MAKKAEKTEPEELPFVLGKWQDLDQWRCKLCPFDTLEGEDAYWLHFARQHAAAPEPEPAPEVQQYDRFGNPIEPPVEE